MTMAEAMARKRILFLLPALIFAVIVGYFVWGLNPARDPSQVPSALIDKSVPAFDLGPLEGSGKPGLNSADLADGRVTLVNFFASWCLPCRVEHPLLTALTEDSGVPLYGINHKDKTADALGWLEDLGNPYARIGVDPGRAAVNWGVYGLPETFVVDGAGTIRYHFRGPLTAGVIEREVVPLLEALQ